MSGACVAPAPATVTPPPVQPPAPAAPPADGYADGEKAGEALAKLECGKLGPILLGFLLGVIGIAIEYIVPPSVPASGYAGRPPDYAEGYIDGYKSECRDQRALAALTGCSCAIIIVGLITSIAAL